MAKVGVSAAARLAGITRATMYKHIYSGKLSAEKVEEGFSIDTAELLRVYGKLNDPNAPQTPEEITPDPEELQREIEHLQILLVEKDARISDLQRTINLLEHRAGSPEPAPARRGFWSRLFGGAAA